MVRPCHLPASLLSRLPCLTSRRSILANKNMGRSGGSSLPLLAWLALAGLGATVAQLQGHTTSLAPFSSIAACLPFSLAVHPSTSSSGGGAYRLIVEAEEADVAEAVQSEVSNGTLHLSLSQPLTTDTCASATVEMPADGLREVGCLGKSKLCAAIGNGGGGQPLTSGPTQVRFVLSNGQGLGSPTLSKSRSGAWPMLLIQGYFKVPSLTVGLLYSGQGDPLLVR